MTFFVWLLVALLLGVRLSTRLNRSNAKIVVIGSTFAMIELFLTSRNGQECISCDHLEYINLHQKQQRFCALSSLNDTKITNKYIVVLASMLRDWQPSTSPPGRSSVDLPGGEDETESA